MVWLFLLLKYFKTIAISQMKLLVSSSIPWYLFISTSLSISLSLYIYLYFHLSPPPSPPPSQSPPPSPPPSQSPPPSTLSHYLCIHILYHTYPTPHHLPLNASFHLTPPITPLGILLNLLEVLGSMSMKSNELRSLLMLMNLEKGNGEVCRGFNVFL